MSTTTEHHRPLPLDMGTLRRHYMPDPPTTGQVIDIQRGIERLDELRIAEQGRLDELDAEDRALAVELADSALAGQSLTGISGRAATNDRTTVERRLQLLEAARSRLAHQLAVAQRDDPTHAGWLADCQRIETEWRIAQTADDPGQRFDQLNAFVALH